MTPDQVHAIREDIRVLSGKVGEIGEDVARTQQWVEDSSCRRHEKAIDNHEVEIQRLKSGRVQFSASLIASLLVMVPVGIGIYMLFRREIGG